MTCSPRGSGSREITPNGINQENLMDLTHYNKLQLHEIDVYKWVKSEEAGYDLGNTAVLEWIQLHAKQFRKDHIKKSNAS